MRQTFESIMLKKSIGSMRGHRSTCSRCRRTPLAGEYLHRLESGSNVCGLCLSALPVDDRAAVSSERVHAAERALAVEPRAA